MAAPPGISADGLSKRVRRRGVRAIIDCRIRGAVRRAEDHGTCIQRFYGARNYCAGKGDSGPLETELGRHCGTKLRCRYVACNALRSGITDNPFRGQAEYCARAFAGRTFERDVAAVRTR